ncbi:MAG: carboxypeptidase regulatory-like domain-containing protein [Candidatus Riflebacteria bacterium]|nr:carboxypeptidase regulatory-like domain-containing protein [Candidatus Riflebacteria bacterium]
MFLRKRNLIFLFVMHFMFLAFFLPGCKEGTQTAPSSALLNTVNQTSGSTLQELTEASTTLYTITGTVISKNTLEKLGNITVAGSYKGQALPITKTTSEGRFFITDIPPGLYDIVFSSHDGTYASKTYIIQVLENGTMSPSSPEVQLSLVNPATSKLQVTISGEVVLQSNNQKLDNIDVEIDDNDSLTPAIPVTYTSAEGKFFFSNLSAGEYKVTAATRTAGYKPQSRNITILSDGTISPSYTIITLPSTANQTYSISGYVRTSSNEVLVNTPVYIYTSTLANDPKDLYQSSPAYTTGEGKFFFNDLLPNIYFLKVASSNSTHESSVYPINISETGAVSPATIEILVSQNDTISKANISGRIFDAFTGGALEYATVKIADISSGLTDNEGNFNFSELLAGIYKIEISKFGYETMNGSFVLNNDGSTVPSSLSYPLIHDMRSGYGSIAGRILNTATGKAISNLTIRAYPWVSVTKSIVIGGETKTATDYEIIPSLVLTTKTSAVNPLEPPDFEGSFKLTHLEPAHYLLYISSDSNNEPGFIYETRGNFTWRVPDRASDPTFVAEIRNITVENGKTTYWTNYEQEYR